MLQKLIKDFRTVWKEDHTREFHVAFSVLHGLVERMTPEQCNLDVERFLYGAASELRLSDNPLSSVGFNLRMAIRCGLSVPVYSTGHNILTPEDAEQIKKVQGYFGMVLKKAGNGIELALVDAADIHLLDTPIISNRDLDLMRFPKAYREMGSGVCWVEYHLEDGCGYGSLEPASTMDDRTEEDEI